MCTPLRLLLFVVVIVVGTHSRRALWLPRMILFCLLVLVIICRTNIAENRKQYYAMEGHTSTTKQGKCTQPTHRSSSSSPNGPCSADACSSRSMGMNNSTLANDDVLVGACSSNNSSSLLEREMSVAVAACSSLQQSGRRSTM